MSYISKAYIQSMRFNRYFGRGPLLEITFIFSCQLYEIQFKYIRKLNIQSSHGMFNVFFRCHTGNDDGAPKRLKKCREIIFMKFVIASLVTRLNFDESKKLICENCHSGAAGIRGGRNISVTNYILQRLIKSRLFPILAA